MKLNFHRDLNGVKGSSGLGSEEEMLTTITSVFSSLESLNLEENQLCDWSDVLMLRHLTV